ncbi:MAG: hypothetical protein K6A95_05640 [Bacteroidales bacterium]|nr:hypothetical protein [Bacteroidales bacterium]
MKQFGHFVAILFMVYLLSSCQKVDLTATYISIDTTSFVMDVSHFNQDHATGYDAGELASISNQHFHDAWVVVNGTSLGTWELPCKIPVLGSDSVRVSIYPGVKMNGVSTMRPRYPFVDPYTTTINLKGGTEIEIGTIPLQYSAVTKFEFIENFNRDYNGIFHASKDNGVNFLHGTAPDNPTNRIGIIDLTDSIQDFEIESSNMTFGNKLPNYVFLEMDYMCDYEDGAEVAVTMLIDKSTTSLTTSEPLVIANASKKWKKIYVNLTQSVSRNQTNAIAYRVQLSGGRPDENIPIHFYFDNIKVIYL